MASIPPSLPVQRMPSEAPAMGAQASKGSFHDKFKDEHAANAAIDSLRFWIQGEVQNRFPSGCKINDTTAGSLCDAFKILAKTFADEHSTLLTALVDANLEHLRNSLRNAARYGGKVLIPIASCPKGMAMLSDAFLPNSRPSQQHCKSVQNFAVMIISGVVSDDHWSKFQNDGDASIIGSYDKTTIITLDRVPECPQCLDLSCKDCPPVSNTNVARVADSINAVIVGALKMASYHPTVLAMGEQAKDGTLGGFVPRRAKYGTYPITNAESVSSASGNPAPSSRLDYCWTNELGCAPCYGGNLCDHIIYVCHPVQLRSIMNGSPEKRKDISTAFSVAVQAAAGDVESSIGSRLDDALQKMADGYGALPDTLTSEERSAAGIAWNAMINAALGKEGRSARAKKIAVNLGSDGCSARSRRSADTLGHAGCSARSNKIAATLGSDGCSARSRRSADTLGHAGRSARTKRGIATLGHAGCSARTKRGIATLGHDGLSARSNKINANLGPDGRSARSKKGAKRGWETRRRNKAALAAEGVHKLTNYFSQKTNSSSDEEDV